VKQLLGTYSDYMNNVVIHFVTTTGLHLHPYNLITIEGGYNVSNINGVGSDSGMIFTDYEEGKICIK
jgi:hypothetical protein